MFKKKVIEILLQRDNPDILLSVRYKYCFLTFDKTKHVEKEYYEGKPFLLDEQVQQLINS
jgi:hypothetical protein